jgi:hypothetical protein
MNDAIIKNLLGQVYLISKRYDEIAKITGEKFNVFKVLDVSTQEVRMHSALIAELLNANGSHGCGSVFLHHFLEQQKEKHKDTSFIRKIEEFTIENSSTKVEYHIGQINEDGTEGGRIDILIQDEHSNQIIFENKINAGDQAKQLIRYNNHNKRAPIFYLTLDGKRPSHLSINSNTEIKTINLVEGDDFVCISYTVDIMKWLEVCVKESVNFPLLRETIQQYIHLIKTLTHQTINHKMKNELVELLAKNTDNLEGAFMIANSMNDVKNSLLQKLKNQLETVASELDVSLISHLSLDKWSGFQFHHPELQRVNLRILFSFDRDLTNNLFYGLHFIDNKIPFPDTPEGNFLKEHQEEFKKLVRLKTSNKWWYACDNFELQNWSSKEYVKILSGEIAILIKQKVVTLLDSFRKLYSKRFQFDLQSALEIDVNKKEE